MATGEVLLPASVFTPSDGSSGNAAPAGMVLAGTATNPKGYHRVWAFDASTQEFLTVDFRLPNDYSSGGTLKLLWTANATSGNVIWAAKVGATTPADADTPIEHAYNTAGTVTTAANTTEARRLVESSITLTMDSAAAGDLISLLVYRDASNGSDTTSVDAELWVASFQYTTT